MSKSIEEKFKVMKVIENMTTKEIIDTIKYCLGLLQLKLYNLGEKE